MKAGLRAAVARLLVVAALCASVVACIASGASPSPSSPESGLRGRVLLGPTCAVERAGQSPCVTPYAAVLVFTDPDGKEVARTTAGSDGTFRVALPPGDYVILPQPGNPFPQSQPLDVTVDPGTYTDVEINYDTGIR